MTTSTPPPPAPTADVCRITVDGPAGRSDLAVPVTLPIAALLPVLLRHAGMPDGEGRTWVLQRLGEEPVDPDGTPQTLGLRHGDVLWLRAAEEALPALHFDDVADGVAHVVSGRPGRWSPTATRVLALAGAGLALLVLAAGLLAAGPGAAAASAAGTAAVLLAAGSVTARRLGTHPACALVAAAGALAFGVLTGLVTPSDSHGGFRIGTAAVLLAGAWTLLVAGALLALRAVPPALPGSVLLLGVAAAGACGLGAAGCSAGQAAAMTAGVLFLLGHLGPRTALRLARLRAPQLPHNTDELQQDIDPQPEERLRTRTAVASVLLDTLALASAAFYLATWWLVAHRGDWTGWVLPLVFGTAVLLRARELTGVVQRVATAVGGAAGPVAVALLTAAPHGTGVRLAVLAGLLLTAAGLLVAAERLPGGRLLPIWGHLGDISEWVTTIALVPLLFQVVHTYSHIRGLA
ncbi:type VII secretion integral membrane protein EccD [Streptomyces sp. NBC_01476]|uniref:type VII secretion integral membrane protein EccD n=1 Tax=Streptomyces sp. NBC_01476 TaxID=2903881 RepID=UPI002E31DDD7|nr:type VII secretion integral membrane protein EccD [Streptomyces sp. NBC_01476]